MTSQYHSAESAGWPELEQRPPDDDLLVLLIELDAVAVQPALLDGRERQRAQQLRGAGLQHDFLAAHTALRQILGWRLGCDPAGLVLAVDGQGKPALPDHRLAFNLSHSGPLALVALGRDGPLGVDVESGARLGEVDGLAARVCAAAELARFLALPAAARNAAFLRAWTRKEAALKALGCGLPGGMEHVVVAEEPLRLDGDFAVHPGLRTLHLADLPAISGHAAALCHGPAGRVHCRRWPRTAGANRDLPSAGPS